MTDTLLKFLNAKANEIAKRALVNKSCNKILKFRAKFILGIKSKIYIFIYIFSLYKLQLPSYKNNESFDSLCYAKEININLILIPRTKTLNQSKEIYIYRQ